MEGKFFISHYSGDKKIAELFSNILGRITLGQISSWYSSDNSSDNGLKPGDIWFNQILNRITTSRAVVALLTPYSINKPWVYFECGIGLGLRNCPVIPVCIGIKRDDILPPLGLYQCYQLNDYRSVVEFFSKLLDIFHIRFDEEMSEKYIENFISEISQISFDNKEESNDQIRNFENVFENFKNHIDKRFIEMLEKQNLKIDNIETSYYSVLFSINFPKFQNVISIDIRDNDSFQSITDTLFFNLTEHINPYTYLEEWMIVEKESRNHIVIREIAKNIPAKYIFTPNTKWEIIKLEKPYQAIDSKNRILLLNNYNQSKD